MTIKEARELKIGEIVRIRNTHPDKKTKNNECVWIVWKTECCEFFGRERCTVTLKLLRGEYVDYKQSNHTVHYGEFIKRSSQAIEKCNLPPRKVKVRLKVV